MARIVYITVTLAAEAEAFRIEFSGNEGTTWLPYSPTDADPVTAAPLSPELLTDGAYLLDGINNVEEGAGNRVAASAAGNWYRVAQRVAGLWGNPSIAIAAAVEPDANGPLADLAALKREFESASLVLQFKTPAEEDTYLSRLLTSAMRTLRRNAEIDALYTGTRSAHQTSQLEDAEIQMAVALLLQRSAQSKVLGTHAPLLMEDAEDIMAVASVYRAEALAITEGLQVRAATGLETGVLSISDPSPWTLYEEELASWVGA